LIPPAALGQADLANAKPDLPEDVWLSKQYMRIRDLNEKRDAAGHKSMDWARWQAWEGIKKDQQKNSQVNIWQNLGPYSKSGRIISIAFHPVDSNVMYAGSASGGLWRTLDYGVSWTPLTDEYPTMGIGAVSINPQNPSSILIATGEGYGFGGEFTSGFGILISHDEGQTWKLTNVTAALSASFAGMDIIWNPIDTSKICVGTSFGIYFSNDGGQNYSYVLDRLPSRIVSDPQNPDILFLTARYYNVTYPGGFYRSFNSGQNWSLVNGAGLPSLTSFGYASIAVHPVFNNIIYLNISKSTVNGQGPMEGLFKSNNFGNSFVQIPANVDLHCYHPPYTNICQGWYDNTIAISPSDTNILIAGGTRMWKSEDGGFNWVNCDLNPGGTNYAVHPDHHQTWFHPITGALFDCNDGGIDYSYNMGANWTSISDGLITHQFYSIAFAETDSEVVIGGTQDVGLFSSTQSISSTNWEQEFNGDAFGCAIDFTNENTWYGSIFMNYQRVKSNNSGLVWSQINSGAPGDQWRMPMVINPTNNMVLISSSDNAMYKTVNGGLSWQQVSNNGFIGYIEFDKINSNIVYATRLFGGNIYRSISGGNSWGQLTGSPGSPITDLATDPLITNKLYATIGSFGTQNQVFKSSNGGITWQNISANLPAVPANSIAVDPFNNSVIYVGNDLGVWVTQDGGTTWSSFNNELPYLVVDDLHYFKPDSTIRIGTYGRGYWMTKALNPVPTQITENTSGSLQIGINNQIFSAGEDVYFSIFNPEQKSMEFRISLYDTNGRLWSENEFDVYSGVNLLSHKAPLAAGFFHMIMRSEKMIYSVQKIIVTK